MKTIEDFCDTHNACSDGREWALANCSTMQEVWDKAPTPYWVIWIATRQGVLTDRELRLFAVWCARQVRHMLTNLRSINAIDVAERYANGEATDEELAAARAAARAAAWAAARTAARAAADAAAWTTTKNATSAADGAVIWIADRTAQARWLRENTKPNFA